MQQMSCIFDTRVMLKSLYPLYNGKQKKFLYGLRITNISHFQTTGLLKSTVHYKPGIDPISLFVWLLKDKPAAYGTSLVAQWLTIRLPMQGTWVPALVWEGPTCRGATKPVHHNY